MSRRKVFNVSICIDIHSVNCPGVWLCPKGKVVLKLSLFGVSDFTKQLAPTFPMKFSERFQFQKVYKHVTSLIALHEKLGDAMVTMELLQYPIGTQEYVRLAAFNSPVTDLLYPSQVVYQNSSKPITSAEVDLLFSPFKIFPGILAPKAEVTTKIAVVETHEAYKGPVKSNPATITSTINEKRRNENEILRQHTVCHSKLNVHCNAKVADLCVAGDRDSEEDPQLPQGKLKQTLKNELNRRVVRSRPVEQTENERKPKRKEDKKFTQFEPDEKLDFSCKCDLCSAYQAYFRPQSVREVGRQAKAPLRARASSKPEFKSRTGDRKRSKPLTVEKKKMSKMRVPPVSNEHHKAKPASPSTIEARVHHLSLAELSEEPGARSDSDFEVSHHRPVLASEQTWKDSLRKYPEKFLTFPDQESYNDTVESSGVSEISWPDMRSFTGPEDGPCPKIARHRKRQSSSGKKPTTKYVTRACEVKNGQRRRSTDPKAQHVRKKDHLSHDYSVRCSSKTKQHKKTRTASGDHGSSHRNGPLPKEQQRAWRDDLPEEPWKKGKHSQQWGPQPSPIYAKPIYVSTPRKGQSRLRKYDPDFYQPQISPPTHEKGTPYETSQYPDQYYGPPSTKYRSAIPDESSADSSSTPFRCANYDESMGPVCRCSCSTAGWSDDEIRDPRQGVLSTTGDERGVPSNDRQRPFPRQSTSDFTSSYPDDSVFQGTDSDDSMKMYSVTRTINGEKWGIKAYAK